MSLATDIAEAEARDRPRVKAEAIAQASSTGEFLKPGIRVTLAEVKEEKGLLVAFAQAHNAAGKQIGFGPKGLIETERFRFVNPPILVPTGTFDAKGQPVFRFDPKEALRQEIAYVIRTMGRLPDAGVKPGTVGRTTTTVYPESGTGTAPVDGYATGDPSGPQTWDTVHDFSGNGGDCTDADPFIGVQATSTTDRWRRMWRGYFGFDTSAIGSDVISAATLTLVVISKANGSGADGLYVAAVTVGSESAHDDDNYTLTNHGGTSFAYLADGDIAGGYTAEDWTLNASGLAHINKSGNTFFGLRIGADFEDAEPTWADSIQYNYRIRMAEFTGTTQDPKLVVTHAPGAGGGVTAGPLVNSIRLKSLVGGGLVG